MARHKLTLERAKMLDEVLRLRSEQLLSYTEIARVVGCPASSVRYLIDRAHTRREEIDKLLGRPAPKDEWHQ